MNIVQLRSTIFLPQNIGYTPENAERFKNLFFGDTDGKVYGIMQPGMPVFGVNPSLPQYGLPWRIFRRFDSGDEYNIVFQVGKIDIVLVKNVPYDNNLEIEFCEKSTKWFSHILDTLASNAIVTRIAYAPLYVFNKKSGTELDAFWNNLLRQTIFDGIKSQDINLSFLLKRSFSFGSKTTEINLLHNIFDGTLTTNENDNPQVVPVILFQLDLNSVPEVTLELGKGDVAAFFHDILTIKESLITNVSK